MNGKLGQNGWAGSACPGTHEENHPMLAEHLVLRWQRLGLRMQISGWPDWWLIAHIGGFTSLPGVNFSQLLPALGRFLHAYIQVSGKVLT